MGKKPVRALLRIINNLLWHQKTDGFCTVEKIPSIYYLLVTTHYGPTIT